MTSVTEYLEATAKKFPNKIAFSGNGRDMSFKELRKEALNIADYLVENKINKEPVVVFMKKSPECIATFLGAAYSGNFYTPIDTNMPDARIEKIMATLKPKIIVTTKELINNAKSWAKNTPLIIYEDIIKKEFAEEELLLKLPKTIDEDTLYVLFTSGSTGNPKGVVIPHRAVINYIDWFTDEFGIDENTIIGNQCPFYFDVSIQDIYATIKMGSTAYLLDKSIFSFPIKLMEFMFEKNINTVFWVTSALCVIASLKGLYSKKLPPLKKILFAGEVMPLKYMNMWKKFFSGATFVNLYGPTESCNIATFYIVDREFADNETLPIGKAIQNVEVILLKEDNTQAKIGERGELCIRGASLSHGYYNNPEKTSEAFCQNPLQKNYPEIIYRTGDLAHLNERGELMYDCRKDFQIKHMGHRIELGEIETAVSSLYGIDRNCCLYDEKRGRIVLFYSGDIEENNLTDSLKNLLPEYMLPSKKIRLEEMPLNLNGKIDRVALKQKL